MAYRKSRRSTLLNHDLYVFRIQHEALFTDEKLETEKIRTDIDGDITALCYTQNDDFLMCGTNKGEIHVIAQTLDQKNQSHYWTSMRKLDVKHDYEITKITFSANHRYLATVDKRGVFKILNGGSWTHIFSYHIKEESREYTHFEWHPFVDTELIIARKFYPAIHLFNVTQRKVVSSFMSWKDNWELSSLAFNPKSAQLAVCFYNAGD
jgi:WD40 repeat protein